MKIKLIQLDIIMLCLTFYEITVLPHFVYIGFKYAVVSYLFLRYFLMFKRVKLIVSLAAVYGAVTVFSSVINHMESSTILASFFYAVQIIVIFLVSERFLSRYPLEDYAKIVFGVFLVLILFTDLLMLIKSYNFHNPDESYLIGNKFVVSYVHCFASALAFLIGYKTEKVLVINHGKLQFQGMSMRLFAFAFSVFSLLVCRKVTCSTGMIACLILIIMMILPKITRRIISNKNVIVIFTAVVNFLLLGSYSILNTSFIHNLIYGYLEKSETWNGRLVIWDMIFDYIGKKPLTGYGFYNTVVANELGFGNPQNAVLKFLLDAGLLGLIAYAALVWFSFREITPKALHKVYPMTAFFYAMIFAALVEINLTHMVVFMAIAMIYCASKNTDRGEIYENRNSLNAESI